MKLNEIAYYYFYHAYLVLSREKKKKSEIPSISLRVPLIASSLSTLYWPDVSPQHPHIRRLFLFIALLPSLYGPLHWMENRKKFFWKRCVHFHFYIVYCTTTEINKINCSIKKEETNELEKSNWLLQNASEKNVSWMWRRDGRASWILLHGMRTLSC